MVKIITADQTDHSMLGFCWTNGNHVSISACHYLLFSVVFCVSFIQCLSLRLAVFAADIKWESPNTSALSSPYN